MLFTIQLHEKEYHHFYCINHNNDLDIYIPLNQGSSIGLNNTCQALSSISSFFHGNATCDSIHKQLLAHGEALKLDLELCHDLSQNLFFEKTIRLVQVCKAIFQIQDLKRQASLTELTRPYPNLPLPFKKLIKQSKNTFCIQLSPLEQDPHTRFDEVSIFSLQRDGAFFAHALRQMQIRQDSFKDTLIDEVLSLDMQDLNLLSLQSKLQTAIFNHKQIEVNLNLSLHSDVWITEHLIAEFYQTAYADLEPRDICNAILNLALDPQFWSSHSDVMQHKTLEQLSAADAWSIKIQFFFAHINAYCIALGITQKNFGHILDKKSIYESFISGLETHLSVANDPLPYIFQFIEKNMKLFQIMRPLRLAEQACILNYFDKHIRTHANNQHFDEFLIHLGEFDGSFVNFNHQIAIHLNHFIEHESSSCQDKPIQALNISHAELDKYTFLLKIKQDPQKYAKYLFLKSTEKRFVFEELPLAILHYALPQYHQYLISLRQEQLHDIEDQLRFQRFIQALDSSQNTIAKHPSIQILFFILSGLCSLTALKAQLHPLHADLKQQLFYISSIQYYACRAELIQELIDIHYEHICHTFAESKALIAQVTKIHQASIQLFLNLYIQVSLEKQHTLENKFQRSVLNDLQLHFESIARYNQSYLAHKKPSRFYQELILAQVKCLSIYSDTTCTINEVKHFMHEWQALLKDLIDCVQADSLQFKHRPQSFK